ncbi:phage portal protein [Paraburkholderia phymatum]|uniref:Phage portal protein, HK97 family n=1 Tax=Paraburkholderia phymatum (strain DSM 17167 / CIP 108236 / LMG 21445 / STM815) TaxID=391038 RepID=B2JL21_PARP8|nr:phage portal protein [Paraburkholderia phymatum]ACC72550.1 phage portal protein, HK97 family [Paraburkholderia phymatum STM815]
MADIRYNTPQREMELSVRDPAGWLPRAFNQALTWLGGGWFGGGNVDEPGQQINTPTGDYYAGSETQAMQISTVWACVRLITETIGTLSINVYERTPTGRNLVQSHPLNYVLNTAPNDRNTPVELLESFGMNLAIDGNCYARIIRDGSGDVISLMPRASQQTTLIENTDNTYFYKYSTGGEQITYQPPQMFHSRLMGNGLKGLSPLGYARRSIANALALQNNALRFNAKGGKPAGVLMIDHVLKPEQREAVRNNFADLEAGGDAGSRLFVLEAGMQYQQLTISPADAQMLEQLKFGVDDICRIFRVPSFLVNQYERNTTWGSGIEQMDLGYSKYTLQPYVTRLESSMNRWLLRPSEQQRYYVEFNLESLLRSDSASRASFYSTMVQNGLMSRNECRVKENLDRRDGADDLTVQLNLTPIEDLPKVADQNTQQQQQSQDVPTQPIKE